MSAYSFFSNNLIYVDGENCEIAKSLKNTRPDVTQTFTAPSHTVGTPNLLVFLDGRLQIKDVDYNDSNSTEIEFTNNVAVNQDVVIILVRAGQGGGGGGTTTDCKFGLSTRDW